MNSEEAKYAAQLVKENLIYQQLWTDINLFEIPFNSDEHTRGSLTLCYGKPPEKIFNDENNDPDETGYYHHEWVLPAMTNQDWSIAYWVQIFEEIDNLLAKASKHATQQRKVDETDLKESESKKSPKKAKRVIMACIDNDGTVVYYNVYRGIMPPRNNT